MVDPPEPEVTPPSAPRNLAVSNLTRTSGKVSWQEPAETGGAEITGYRIIKPGTEVTVAADVRSYTVAGLTAGTAYTIAVQAENAEGYGPATPITLKTKPLARAVGASLVEGELVDPDEREGFLDGTLLEWGRNDHGVSDHQAGDRRHRQGDCPLVHRHQAEGGHGLHDQGPGEERRRLRASRGGHLEDQAADEAVRASLVEGEQGDPDQREGLLDGAGQNGGTKITGYRIVKPGKDVTVKAKARSYTVKKLKAGKAYTIKVQARNAKGYGPSAAIKFKTKPPAPKLKTTRTARRCRGVPARGGKAGATDQTSGQRPGDQLLPLDQALQHEQRPAKQGDRRVRPRPGQRRGRLREEVGM